MTFHEVDQRQGDADREFAYWTQRGCDPDVVSTMLPALVAADSTTRESGARFLEQYGSVGHGPDVAGKAREVTEMARESIRNLMEDGGFTGDPMYQPGTRFSGMSNEAIDRQWDEMHPRVGPYSDHSNHEVIEEADVLNGLDRGTTTYTETESGSIVAHYHH